MSMIPLDDFKDKRQQFEALGYGKVERPTREADRYTYETEPALAVQVVRKLSAVLTGAAIYLVTYGMLLTFGLLAVITLALGFTTLPSPADLLGTSSSSSTSFTTTPTPRASSPAATKTATAAAPAKTPAQQAGDTIRSLVRIIAFGAGFLAIWPAWFVGSLAWRHFNQ